MRLRQHPTFLSFASGIPAWRKSKLSVMSSEQINFLHFLCTNKGLHCQECEPLITSIIWLYVSTVCSPTEIQALIWLDVSAVYSPAEIQASVWLYLSAVCSPAEIQALMWFDLRAVYSPAEIQALI
jgi:hypothetical protein